MNAGELPLSGEPPPLGKFEAHKKRDPAAKIELIAAGRDLLRIFGVQCDIQTAFGLAKARREQKKQRMHCRSFVTDYAREITKETELKYVTRPRRSRGDGMGALL